MATANAQRNPSPDREQLRNDWLSRLNDLVERVEGWARELGWSTRRVDKQMEDSQIGTYDAPALLLQEEATRVFLEPIARSAPGVEGVVDLYRMPAYDDVASLYFYDGDWRLHPMLPDRGEGSKPLSRESLQEVLEELKRNGG
jgi:hypothetical protein